MKWKAIAMVLLAVFCIGFVQADPAIWDNPQVVKKLGLTEDQQQKLESLQVEHRKFEVKNRAEVDMLEIDLRQLWKADALDESKILAKVKAISDLRQKRAVEDASHRIAVHRILTPEQRKQVKEFVQKRMQERREAQPGAPGARWERMQRMGERPFRGPGEESPRFLRERPPLSPQKAPEKDRD